jgi:hypothetical protein
MEKLRDIVLRAKDTAGSYAKLSERCGNVPTAARLQQMATNGLGAFPDPEVLDGIARGARVRVRDVILAAALDLGMAVDDGDKSPLELRLPSSRDLGVLTTAQVDALATLAWELVNTHKQIASLQAN